MTTPSRQFGFSEDVQYAYTHGKCWYLTLALMEETNLEPVAVWCRGTIHHVGVLLPNKDIVDIEGVWLPQSWESLWEMEMDKCPTLAIGPVSDTDAFWSSMMERWNTERDEILSDSGEPDIALREIRDTIMGILNKYDLLKEPSGFWAK